jgi:AraC-like DNA-binding protein
MTITLSQSDLQELYDITEFTEIEFAPDLYEVKGKIPELLGKGQFWEIDLCEECILLSKTWQMCNDHKFYNTEREHEVEICLWIPACHSNRNGHYTLFGSGIAPQEIWQSPADGKGVYLSIGFEPDLLKKLYGNASGELPPELQLLIKDNDWQIAWRDRPINSKIISIVRDIFACPFQGLTKQMYIQGKTLELLALQLESLQSDNPSKTNNYHLKKQTVEKIYQARELLLQNWENPPSILELARQVGLSDRTLRRGFQEIFGASPIAYLINYRLKQAEQILRYQNLTIAQVAHKAGYSSASRFAAAFKQKFGISPCQCCKGGKSVFG